MGADNYARCPRCISRGEKKLNVQKDVLDHSYGVIPLEQFDQARADLEQARLKLVNIDPSFREDWKISGAATGTVTVTYSGSCSRCGLKLEFEEDHEIHWLDND